MEGERRSTLVAEYSGEQGQQQRAQLVRGMTNVELRDMLTSCIKLHRGDVFREKVELEVTEYSGVSSERAQRRLTEGVLGGGLERLRQRHPEGTLITDESQVAVCRDVFSKLGLAQKAAAEAQASSPGLPAASSTRTPEMRPADREREVFSDGEDEENAED
eukprot:612799-Prymnesium_polylepis.1